ncbi:hypothetical protein SDC9_206511 [bioreactor metagenome]|uniref:Uncharacterized protein n=1 Tax=bioreactor metagenome TaxID=1076179 RepID=A0A645J5R7_9ZZZZ
MALEECSNVFALTFHFANLIANGLFPHFPGSHIGLVAQACVFMHFALLLVKRLEGSGCFTIRGRFSAAGFKEDTGIN